MYPHLRTGPLLSSAAGALSPSFSLRFADTGSLVPTIGAVAPAYARATVSSVDDHEQVVRAVLSGEARFRGLRRVRNHILTSSEDLSAANWTPGANGTGVVPTVTGGFAAGPLNGMSASRVQFDHGAGDTAADWSRIRQSLGAIPTSATPIRQATWLKTNDGSVRNISLRGSSGGAVVTVSVTADWQRFSAQTGSAGGAATWELYYFGDLNAGIPTADILVSGALAEDTTGQSNVNPSEYVSVGVLAAPYHGAGVDGVRWFPTENSNVVAGNVVYDHGPYLTLPGAAGDYAGAPVTAAMRVTGDISLRARLAATDWSTGGANQTIIARSTGGARCYRLLLTATGALQLGLADPVTIGTEVSAASSDTVESLGIAAGQPVFLRADWRQSDGRVQFFYSTDGSAWVQIGTDQSIAIGSIGDSAVRPLEVGSSGDGASAVFVGRIFSAAVYSGTTLVAQFNAARQIAGAATVSGGTGETWTINGAARLTGGAIASSTRKGLSVWTTRINIALQSENLSVTWVNTRSSDTQAAGVAPNGTTTANKLIEDATAGSDHFIQEPATYTAAIHTLSVWARAAENSWVHIRMDDGTTAFTGYFNLAAGTIGTLLNATAEMIPYPDGWYRCIITTTVATAAAVGAIRITLAEADLDTTIDGDGVSGIYVWGAQLEAAQEASPYIPTTTLSVTRNAEQPSYPVAGWLKQAEGTLVVKGTAGKFSGANKTFALIGADSNDCIRLIRSVAATRMSGVVALGGVTQASLANPVAIADGGAFAAAFGYKASDFALATNGSVVDTVAAGSLPALSPTLFLYRGASSEQSNSEIASVDYYSRRSANADIKRLAA
jgi:hypothetical protein